MNWSNEVSNRITVLQVEAVELARLDIRLFVMAPLRDPVAAHFKSNNAHQKGGLYGEVVGIAHCELFQAKTKTSPRIENPVGET